MRSHVALLAVLLVFSGCLKKLETMTEETRNQVQESVQAVKDTHNGQKFSTALNGFMTTTEPSLRAATAESMILLAEADRLPKYIGMARPPEYDNLTEYHPNVTWVGTEDGDKDLANFNYEHQMWAVKPSTVHTLFAACLSGLKYLLGASFKDEIKREEIETKARRAIPFCTAIFGAQRLPVVNPVDAKDINKRAWPLTPTEKLKVDKAVVKGKEEIRQVLSLPIFDSDHEFRVNSERQIEVKIDNRLDLSKHDEEKF